MRLAAGLSPDLLPQYTEEAIALTNLLAVYGYKGGKGKERVWNREGRKGWR